MMIPRKHLATVSGAVFWLCAASVQSQQDGETDDWTGQWSAEGLPFVVEARARDDRLAISPVMPTGQGWSTSNGRIGDDSATIEAEYQGVTARILIELVRDDTAIARTVSCRPDYHFVCTLARNQQALFHRQPGSGPQ
ncbi:MAG: hypothetical protein ACQETO_11565 [Pseudomonadota bacterium]